jgi:phasin family protein
MEIPTMDMNAETLAGQTEQTAHDGANAARETVNAGADAAKDSMNAGAQAFGHAAAAGDRMMRDAMDRASQVGDQAFKDGMEKSLQALNELNAQSKRNLEAVVESVTAATKGAETLSNEAMTYTRKTVEGHVEQARALSGARSVQEVVELQTTYAKSAMEAYIAQMNKAAEIMSDVVKQSFRPLNERATAMVETMQSAR